MSLPRQILPGEIYLVTRRCVQRQYLLRPSRRVNEVVLYCLSVAAKKYGVQVHAVCVMSNHYHLVVSDPEARLPAFVGWLDALAARCLNALRGRWESMWSAEGYSAVRLVDEVAVVAEIAYTLANPVSAGLVREGHQWPGLRFGVGLDQIGQVVAARRPHFFFRAAGSLPEVAHLELVRPPRCVGKNDEEFVAAVRCEVARREDEARREMVRARRGVVGRHAVLAQSPAASPTSWEPRRALRPRLACRDRWRRIEAIQRLRSFVAAYREAWRHFRAGVRDVLFPVGTYALRVNLGVRCAPS